MTLSSKPYKGLFDSIPNSIKLVSCCFKPPTSTSSQEAMLALKQSGAVLQQRNLELEEAMRARDRVTTAVESKTEELERGLVGFSAQIMTLRGELSVKEHVSHHVPLA